MPAVVFGAPPHAAFGLRRLEGRETGAGLAPPCDLGPEARLECPGGTVGSSLAKQYGVELSGFNFPATVAKCFVALAEMNILNDYIPYLE